MSKKSPSPDQVLSDRILVIISAPSGAGKTTLCQRLLASRPDLLLSISSTTRAPRGTEVDGREYHFLDRSTFERQIQEGVFAEWAKVHDQYYGTSRRTIEEAFSRGRHVLLDIDVQGAASLRDAYGPARTLTVFIAPPSIEVLERRLRARGTDREEVIQKRMHNARREMEAAPSFDCVIVNDDLDRAFAELSQVVASHLDAGGGSD